MAKIVQPEEVGKTKINTSNTPPTAKEIAEMAEDVTSERKPLNKITTGEVKMQRKSSIDKFKDSVFMADLNSTKDYIVMDVLVPTLQDMIVNMVRGGIETLIYGGDSRNIRRNTNRSYVSYSSMSNKQSSRPVYKMNREAAKAVDDVVVETRDEAENILDTLIDLTREYGCASLADLKDLIGVSSNYNDYKWGWKENLARESGIRKCRDGWLIQLPSVDKID